MTRTPEELERISAEIKKLLDSEEGRSKLSQVMSEYIRERLQEGVDPFSLRSLLLCPIPETEEEKEEEC